MKSSQPQVCAIIPARGGSKSIPGKNIKPLGGIPLITYSIAAGLQSKGVQRVIVSTDDEEIANIARTYGAEVPFLRPSHLAADHVTDLPVFTHALQWLASEESYTPDYVVQLRPTSPFRPLGCVDKALEELLASPQADSLRAITSSGQNPYKMWFIKAGYLEPLLSFDQPEPYNMPRQQLPPTYWQTGILEIIKRETILEKSSMTGEQILPYYITPDFAVDLDTPLNWQFAEFLLATNNLSIIQPHHRGFAIA